MFIVVLEPDRRLGGSFRYYGPFRTEVQALQWTQRSVKPGESSYVAVLMQADTYEHVVVRQVNDARKEQGEAR
jgi:hypothetical protein